MPLEEAAPADRVPEEEGAGKEEQTAARIIAPMPSVLRGRVRVRFRVKA